MSTAATDPAGIEDLDPVALLDALRDADHRDRVAERDKLLIALHWCLLHPATVDTGVAGWRGPFLPGPLDADESLGGDGTPAVAAFTPEPFAAALGISTWAGMQLADALDLRYRLPNAWALVQSLAGPGRSMPRSPTPSPGSSPSSTPSASPRRRTAGTSPCTTPSRPGSPAPASWSRSATPWT